MTVLRDVSEPEEDSDAVRALDRFSKLVDDKAWEHLGVTGEEFKRLWYAGTYKDDLRPAVRALDLYMRSGEWRVP